jgi:hypothetical protein
MKVVDLGKEDIRLTSAIQLV